MRIEFTSLYLSLSTAADTGALYAHFFDKRPRQVNPVTPFEGARLVIRVDDEYYLSGVDCEIIGAVVRDERLPIINENVEGKETGKTE